MRRRANVASNRDEASDQETSSRRNERKKHDKEDTDACIHGWTNDIRLSLATSVLLLIVYVVSLHPSVPGGDSGELIVSAFELGVAHPPGYPLFTILSKIMMTIIPFRSPAWRVNLLNAVFSAAASCFLQLSVLRLTRCVGSSLMAVGLFSVSKLTWTWSVSAEVFGLNNCFVGLLMVLAVDFDLSAAEPASLFKKLYVLAFVSGLSLCNQHTIVVYVLFIGFWAVLKTFKAKKFNLFVLAKAAAFGILGLTPYLYLSLSSYLNVARWSWGDQRSLEGFITHILRQEYGTFDLGKDQQGLGFVKMMSVYGEHLQSRMCELCPWLMLIGFVAALSWFAMKRNSCSLVFCLMTAAYMSFFAWRANLDISNPLFKGVVERFWMQTDMGVAFMAGIGYHTAVRMVTEKFLGLAKISMATVFTTMGAGILIVLQLKNYPSCSQSSNLVVRDFAHTILSSMPPNAIILTKGDLPSNSLRYFHLCENVRRDLQIIDVEVLTYQWSLPMLKKFYPRLNFPGDLWQLNDGLLPDGRKAFSFKTFLDANYKKYPMFACIGMQEHDLSWQRSYKLWPFGVCHKVEALSRQMVPKQWGNQTGGFADKWTYTYDGFGATTWEKVANDEMWHAKISIPFFFYKLAEQTDNLEQKADLLAQSYELYFRAIKLNQKPSKMSHVESFPSFWHKNFALVCERLLHVEPPSGLDKGQCFLLSQIETFNQYGVPVPRGLNRTKHPVRLCKLSIYHFQQYVHLTPSDTDNDSINNAVSILKQRLDTYEKLDRVDKTIDDTVKRAEKLEELHRAMTSRQELADSIRNRPKA